ncbi:MAG: cobalamin-independent methionine synthase II family protein [Burkholderiaceae bacterium]|nr:cobalamin-independent methionine synthase II family protein [Burkholderiaceae bacterium]
MPRIKTTVVGSYPVPDWLVASPSEQALLDATRVVIGIQEQAGIDLVCDGELYRFDIDHPETNGMIEYFVRPMDGITQRFSFDDLIAWRSDSGMKFRTRPPGTVIGPLGHGSLDLPLACARAKALAAKPFKFTVTGPHMLAKTLIDRHYRGMPELAHALADVLASQVRHLDADVVQIDEANLPGHPDEWEWAASAINRVLDAVPGTPAVHLCFGNYGGQTVQKGGWDKLVRYLNALHADHVVLECAHRPPEELAVFADLDPRIGFGLGVVDIKVTDVESADDVARAIERAEKTLGAGRVRYIHPDCGFWMLKRSIADAKIRALRAGRDRFEGIATREPG